MVGRFYHVPDFESPHYTFIFFIITGLQLENGMHASSNERTDKNERKIEGRELIYANN